MLGTFSIFIIEINPKDLSGTVTKERNIFLAYLGTYMQCHKVAMKRPNFYTSLHLMHTLNKVHWRWCDHHQRKERPTVSESSNSSNIVQDRPCESCFTKYVISLGGIVPEDALMCTSSEGDRVEILLSDHRITFPVIVYEGSRLQFKKSPVTLLLSSRNWSHTKSGHHFPVKIRPTSATIYNLLL